MENILSHLLQPGYLFFVVLAVLLILIELFLIPGVGFIFASLAGLTLSSLLVLNAVELVGWTSHILAFMVLTIFWSILLWKPLKNSYKKTADSYKNLQNSPATVVSDEITKDKQGYVKWSGTKVRAILSAGSQERSLSKDTEVWVHSQEDGVLIIDSKKLTNNSN